MKTFVKYLTIRNVPAQVAEALDQEKRRRGRSLNQTVIELLKQSLGVDSVRSNGLGRLAGSWTDEDHDAFERATAAFEKVDSGLWE